MGNIPRRRLKFDPSEEKVGYCRPPKHSQFKPGQCHSKGRPKGSRNFRNIIKSTLMKLLTVTRNGKTRKVPTIEALLLRELEKAFAGDARARAWILQIARIYCDEEVAATVAGLTEEDAEVLRFYQKRLSSGAAAIPCEGTESSQDQTPPNSADDDSERNK